MPEEKNTGFSVLTADERLPAFALFSRIISESRGINHDDAGRIARHAWGFIGENITETEADKLVELCAVYGLNAIKKPAGAVQEPEPPLHIKKLVFSEGILNYTDVSAGAGSTDANALTLLAAAPVKEITTKTVKTREGPSSQEKAIRFGIMAVTGLPIGMGKSKEVKKEVTSSELSFCLDIISRPTAVRLRLSSNDFDFSCLKEKKTYSSQSNFRLLCAELAAFAPAALKNAGLLAILESKPLAPLPYDSPDDYEQEILRLNNLIR